MVVAILGQDSPSIVTCFWISHPVLFPTLFALGSGISDDYYQRYEMHWYRVIYTDSRKSIGRHPRWSHIIRCLGSQSIPSALLRPTSGPRSIAAAASAYVLTSWPLFNAPTSLWIGAKTDEIQATTERYIRRNSLYVPWRSHLWGTLHSWSRVPSRREMDWTITEMAFFDGMDRSSKRELSSIKEPLKYSSESWMSSWTLYEPSFVSGFTQRAWYERTEFFKCAVVG